VSWSERDLAEGYCARCRDWTGAGDQALVCDACGAERPPAGTGQSPFAACDRGHSPALMRRRWAVPDCLEPQGLFRYVPPDPLTLAQLGDTLGQQTREERQQAAAHYIRMRYLGVPRQWDELGVVDAAAPELRSLPPVSRRDVESAPTARQREWFEATGLLVNRGQTDLLGSPEGNNPVNGIPYQNQGNRTWETDIWDEEDWADAATWHPDYTEP
jgi:hypothetical protein